MACASPYDLFVRYQVTRGVVDIHEMNRTLLELSLPRIHQDQLDRQYDLVSRAVPPRILEATGIPRKQVGQEFLKWMAVLEVKELWQTQKAFFDVDVKKKMNFITGMLDDPQLTMTVNALLMKACMHRDICEVVQMKFTNMIKEEHLALYQKFFFDPQRMTRKDWKDFVRKCPATEQSIYFTALTEPVEIVKNELELPSSLPTSAPLQYLMTKCFQKAKHYLEVSTKEANCEARAWISQFSGLVDKYERYKTGDKADFAKQLQMEFEFVDNEFPTADADILEQIQMDFGDKK